MWAQGIDTSVEKRMENNMTRRNVALKGRHSKKKKSRKAIGWMGIYGNITL